MSVLIKGMEMPTSCENCELAKHFDGYNENDCPFNAFSFYDCPLVELPDHGDLTDRDALWQKMKDLHEKREEEANMTGNRVECVTWDDAVVLVKNAPVVIPAERSEE